MTDSYVQAAPAATRPFYWSIRRELWENRSLYLAPLIVAAVVLFGSLVSTAGLPKKLRDLPADAAERRAVTRPFRMAPAPIMLTTILVGFFYSLESLYGERRDRSLLFWKSLPVSDRTTVLSKFFVPMAVLPLTGFILSFGTLMALLFAASVRLIARGVSPAALWTGAGVIPEPLIMLYGMTVHALWFAPLYAWLILVSAWSKRAPLLWAVLPLFVIGLAERIAAGTTHFGKLLKYRFTGAMIEAFGADASKSDINSLTQLTPLRFLTSAGLWLGLAFAAACLAAAIRLRRHREPI